MDDERRQNHDLVLVMCPFWDVEEPPLGLAYLAEHLSVNHWRVRVVDLNLGFYLAHPARQGLWRTASMYDRSLVDTFRDDILDGARQITRSHPAVVGFSVNQKNLCVSVAVARKVKELDRHIVVVFGGPDCFLKPDRDYIPPDALDYFVVGDGEFILQRLLSRLVSGRPLGDIGGVLRSGQNRHLEHVPENYPSHGKLRHPTFKQFPVEQYIGRSLPVLFTRGCVRRCVFCNDRSYYRDFSVSAPGEAADRLQSYVDLHGLNTFSFHDQAINGAPAMCRRFMEEIVRRRMEINWSANCMVRGGMDREFFGLMKSAGCRNLFFGVESFSPRVLERMKKGFSVDEARDVLRSCKEAEIGVLINLIVGFPGETEEDVEETVRFLEQNRAVIDMVLNLSTCFVAPNSDLERRPEAFGIVLPRGHFANWYSLDGHSTNKTRMALADRMQATLQTLGIPYQTVNILRDNDLKGDPIRD